MPYCSNCGEEVEAAVAFCPSCGTKSPTGGTEEATAGREQGDRTQTQRSARRRESAADGQLPVRLGVVAGVAAFAIGYLFTYAKESGEAAESLSSVATQLSSSPETWQGIGWLFMAMHHVTVEVAGEAGTRTVSQSLSAGAIEEQWMLLVPVVALVAAGYWVAKQTPDHTNVSGPKAGATIVAGYLVCAVAIGFLSEWSLSTSLYGESVSMRIGPKLVEAVGIAGVGYPVVLGAIGGAIGDS